MTNMSAKKDEPTGKLNEEQRQKLRKRLEKETDEYFKSCKRKEYTEGWNEETWEKEMTEHPLFATSTSESGELPPLLEALRQIKYDETENSPEELARSYKEDGNHLFKNQDYRAAIASYTEGIRQKTINSELNAQLYLNRAAANFHLSNFGASLEDCIQALELKPDYVKAMSRALKCCWNLRKLDECEEFCKQILARKPDEATAKEAREFAEKCSIERKIQERNKRKREKEQREQQAKQADLARLIQRGGVQLNPPAEEGEILPDLTPRYLALKDFPVSVVEDLLIWPVALLYPELKETDFVQRWNEDSTFKQMLDAMYGEAPTERKVVGEETVITYDPAELQVWYKSSKTNRPVAVRLRDTLRKVIAQKDFVVEDGVPSFWVFRKNSKYEKKFLEEQGN